MLQSSTRHLPKYFSQRYPTCVPIPKKTVYDRDCRITADYLQALDTLGSGTKPFFSFLFYDLAHGYEVPKDKLYRFQPSWEFADYMKLNNDIDPTPFLNLYYNCVAEADSLVGCVLHKLEEKKLLDNTLVIINRRPWTRIQ